MINGFSAHRARKSPPLQTGDALIEEASGDVGVNPAGFIFVKVHQTANGSCSQDIAFEVLEDNEGIALSTVLLCSGIL